MTFYPYTMMNASYVALGSLLAPSFHPDRALGMVAVYLLAVGISAHALDAAAPNRPWGVFLSRSQLYFLAGVGLAPALGLGLYYALTFAPLLVPLGLIELFFLLAYNLEWFGAYFHTDLWFAVSWGFLPVLAGFIVQAGGLSSVPLFGGLFGFLTAYVEIGASRPYKELKRGSRPSDPQLANRLESVLKGIVITSIAAPTILFVYRLLL